MVLLSTEMMRALMRRRENIRNMSVIAHVDHGKTTLSDSLLSRAGVIGNHAAGEKCAMDTRTDEQLKGITIKSTAVSLHHALCDWELETLRQMGRSCDGGDFLVNLIDSPGHVDFSSEVTAALRVTDGAMVVVDCVSGVCVQTETVLRQALTEHVKPVLMMNKMDRCILEKQLEPEELYRTLRNTVENVNAIIGTYQDEKSPMGDLMLDPVRGNVAFGSGKQGWAFTLAQFAEFYSAQLGVKKEKFIKKLWGGHFYSPETRKWSKAQTEGSVRGFNKFVLKPIYTMLKACQEGEVHQVEELLSKVSLGITAEEKELKPKELTRVVMKRWLPAGDAMFQLIILHLPSPLEAQPYRTAILYEGPSDDLIAQGIRACDASAPLMVYISKMVPTSDKGRFFAFGRVFSGEVQVAREKIRILGPDYRPNYQRDLTMGTIQKVAVMMGAVTQSVGSVPAGNLVAVYGIDKQLVKTGVLTDSTAAHNMKTLKFSVSPVVRVAVEPASATDLPKLVEGLVRLSKADPMVQVITNDGENVVAGAGELHLEICIADLEKYAGVAIRCSDPVVTYTETVTEESSVSCLAKSGNKHNRFWVKAEPMPEGLAEDIEKGVVSVNQDVKERARYMAETYNLDATLMKKIWCFGPNGRGPNMLVDRTKGVQGLGDVKDMVVAGFQWAVSEAALCEEDMRGVMFYLDDAKIHSDPAQRKGGQIIPTARKAVLAAYLAGCPRLLEPVYQVDIQAPDMAVSGIYATIAPRRGHVISEERVGDTPMCNIRAYLPVNESFGFNGDLRGKTGGKAFPQCAFDHWQVLPGDPQEEGTLAQRVTHEVRARKGLPEKLPTLDMFLDKL